MLDYPSIMFERATAEDATALLDLEKRVAAPKSYEPHVKIEDAINEIEANTFYFTRYRDRIIGSASFRMQGDGSAYIGNVAVDSLYRRQGVARAAMKFLIRQLGHATRLELVTHPENRHALRLYASLDFRTEAEIASVGHPRSSVLGLSPQTRPYRRPRMTTAAPLPRYGAMWRARVASAPLPSSSYTTTRARQNHD